MTSWDEFEVLSKTVRTWAISALYRWYSWPGRCPFCLSPLFFTSQHPSIDYPVTFKVLRVLTYKFVMLFPYLNWECTLTEIFVSAFVCTFYRNGQLNISGSPKQDWPLHITVWLCDEVVLLYIHPSIHQLSIHASIISAVLGLKPLPNSCEQNS